MARGHIYYITTNKDEDVFFSESNYYETLDTIGADYVEDIPKEESEEPLKWLSDSMFNLGASIIHDNMPGFAFGIRFDMIERMHKDYFGPRLEKLKKEAEKLDIFQVIRSAPSLDYICNNQYGDAVEFYDTEMGDSGTFLTMDDFMRRIRPGVTYYVYEKLILMH